ncbi:MAG TPA: hypothetical protein VMV31_08820 [Terriglobales bacterium]|nr:hypothetical protein [Terriglobales bacterium]
MRQHKGEVARAYWRELIEAQAKSGQNVAEFCRVRGIGRLGAFQGAARGPAGGAWS